MGKQRKSNKKKNGVIGKGKVTPLQVVFIVDRYLADNNYAHTRASFRSEASSLFSKSSLQEAPKSLLSLGELLDEYIWLKEQKVMIEQEKSGLALESSRIHTLLEGMQDLINVFNSSPNSVTSPPPSPIVMPNPSSPGCPASKNTAMTTVSMTQSLKIDHTNFSTSIIGSSPPRKRKNSKDLHDVAQPPKKYCSPVTNTMSYNGTNSVPQPYYQKTHPLKSTLLNFANNVFEKPSSSPNSNSSCPKTPPKPLSSQSDNSISPLEGVSSTTKSRNDSTPPETTHTNCTIISSKTIITSPAKCFSIKRSHCTFSSPVKANKWESKRERVKGRLDFDSSNTENTSADGNNYTSTSEKERDIFDFDLPDFDAFGPDFSFTEFFSDCGIDL